MIEQIITDGKGYATRCTSMDREIEHIFRLGSLGRRAIVPGRKYLTFEGDHMPVDGSLYRVVGDDGTVTCNVVGRARNGKFWASEIYSIQALPDMGTIQFLDGVTKLATENWGAASERLLDAALDGSPLTQAVALEYAVQVARLGYHVIIVDAQRAGDGQVVDTHPFVQGKGMIRYEATEPNYVLGMGEFVLDAECQDKIWTAHCKAVKAARAAANRDVDEDDDDYYDSRYEYL